MNITVGGTTKLAVTLVAAALVSGWSAGEASAQQQPPPGGYASPPPGIMRSGFIIGFSLGGGSMVPSCDGCESLTGVALDLHLGGMVSPNLALMWDGSGIGKSEGGDTLTHTINAFAVQHWVASQVWLKGGLGFGRLSLSSDGNTIGNSETRPALLGAAGFEVLQTRRFALDLSARIVPVFYSELTVTNISFQVGFNWY